MTYCTGNRLFPARHTLLLQSQSTDNQVSTAEILLRRLGRSAMMMMLVAKKVPTGKDGLWQGDMQRQDLNGPLVRPMPSQAPVLRDRDVVGGSVGHSRQDLPSHSTLY